VSLLSTTADWFIIDYRDQRWTGWSGAGRRAEGASAWVSRTQHASGHVGEVNGCADGAITCIGVFGFAPRAGAAATSTTCDLGELRRERPRRDEVVELTKSLLPNDTDSKRAIDATSAKAEIADRVSRYVENGLEHAILGNRTGTVGGLDKINANHNEFLSLAIALAELGPTDAAQHADVGEKRER
jgi:hypothetical protein